VSANGRVDGLVTGLVNQRLPHVVGGNGALIPVLVVDMPDPNHYTVIMPDPESVMGVSAVWARPEDLQYAYPA
jgi:hypothetical protein